MTVKTTYIAKDGREFPDEQAAIKHEYYLDEHAARCKELANGLTREIVDLICPEHSCRSCSDKDPSNGLSIHGCRCTRCGLLDILDTKDMPTSFNFYVSITHGN